MMSDQLSSPAMSSPFPTFPTAEAENEHPFYLFPKLPIELRLKIWKLNMAELQIVKISAPHPKDSVHIDGVTYSAEVVNSICITPQNLHINHEFRAEALKWYKPVLATRLGHHMFFDFSKDYLWFDGNWIQIRLFHFLDSSDPRRI
jgi:hypothetical protein